MKTYIELAVVVTGNGQTWTGQAWWQVPDGTVGWDGYAHAICRAVLAGIATLGLGKEIAFQVDGQSYQVEDDLARKIETINTGLGLDDYRRITWTVKAAPRRTAGVRHNQKGGVS